MESSPRRPLPAPLALSGAVREFLAAEVASAIALIGAALVAIGWANSPWQDSYHQLWSTVLTIGVGRWHLDLALREWVNEGLMAMFFLVVGLEVKRELLHGELRDRRRALLPVVGAVGGMAVPALIYLLFNAGGVGSHGWGIPMATDIAFALGVLAVVAPGLPESLRVYLLALAIVDDIGAIVVIALFYSGPIEAMWIGGAAGGLLIMYLGRRFGLVLTPLYVALGVAVWLAVHAAGLHPTIAGVAIGLLATPSALLDREIIISRHDELLDVSSPEAARTTSRLARHAVSQLEWLEHELHPWTSWVVVPVFALANAGVTFSATTFREAVTSRVALGVAVGLVVGKSVGIGGASWLACRLGWADLPSDATWRHLMGVAAIGGVGFTVSLFVSGLAFDDQQLATNATVGVFVAALVAATVALLLLAPARHAPH